MKQSKRASPAHSATTPPPRLDGLATRQTPRLALRRRDNHDTEPLLDLLRQDEYRRHGALLDPFHSPDDIATFLSRQAPGSFEVVATLGDTVAGFAGLYPLGGTQTHVGNITLCVDENCQGRGIGTALMSAIVVTAKVMVGVQRLQLAVFTDNAKAITLYRRFGFRIEGRLLRFAQRSDGFADAFVMALVTPPA